MSTANDVTPQPERPTDEWVTGDEPMTGPQQSYLQTLAREAGEEPQARSHQSRRPARRSNACSRSPAAAPDDRAATFELSRLRRHGRTKPGRLAGWVRGLRPA